MASRSLGSLTLDLILKYGGFEQGMDRASRTADKRMREIEARAKKFGTFIGGALAAGATAAAAGLVAATKSAIDYADHLNDLNQRLGISAEALSGWAYAAQQTGTDIDALGKGLKILAKNMAEALDPKSQQAGLFKALGVEVKDAHGNLRDLESVLPEIASKFKELDNATTEAALSQQLFGKSGVDLLEFLNQGEDGLEALRQKARDLGVELSSQTLSAADEFNDKLADLRTLGLAAGVQLAEKLLPAMIQLVDQLRSGAQEGNGFGGVIGWVGDQASAAAKDIDFIVRSFDAFKDTMDALWTSAKGFSEVLLSIGRFDLNRLKRAIDSLQSGGSGIREGLSRNVREGTSSESSSPGVFTVAAGSEGAPLSAQERSALERSINGFLGGGSETGKGRKSGKSDAEKEAEQLKAAYDRMNESLAQQIALFGQDGEAARIRYEIEHGELSKLSQAQKDALVVQAESLDMMRAEAELQHQLDQANKRREESVTQILQDIQTERDLLGKTVEFQDTYNKLKWAGVDANSAYGQSIIQANEALHEQIRITADQIGFMDGLRDSAKGFLHDLKDGVGIWDSLKNAADRFADTVFDIVSSRIIEQMFGQTGTTQSGAAGGFWANLAGALFGGGRAGGGPTSAGMFYRVNENGPEMLSVSGKDYLMMGSKSGVVTPNHALNVGRGVAVTQNFYNPQMNDPRSESQRQQVAAQKLRMSARNG